MKTSPGRIDLAAIEEHFAGIERLMRDLRQRIAVVSEEMRVAAIHLRKAEAATRARARRKTRARRARTRRR